MATYLCVKVSSGTRRYSAKYTTEAGRPYLRVSNGYFPLTTETTTGPQIKVRKNNTVYRIVETYTTSKQITITTGTSYSTQSSTYSTTYATRSSTSNTTYLTQSSTYSTTYQTKTGQGQSSRLIDPPAYLFTHWGRVITNTSQLGYVEYAFAFRGTSGTSYTYSSDSGDRTITKTANRVNTCVEMNNLSGMPHLRMWAYATFDPSHINTHTLSTYVDFDFVTTYHTQIYPYSYSEYYTNTFRFVDVEAPASLKINSATVDFYIAPQQFSRGLSTADFQKMWSIRTTLSDIYATSTSRVTQWSPQQSKTLTITRTHWWMPWVWGVFRSTGIETYEHIFAYDWQPCMPAYVGSEYLKAYSSYYPTDKITHLVTDVHPGVYSYFYLTRHRQPVGDIVLNSVTYEYTYQATLSTNTGYLTQSSTYKTSYLTCSSTYNTGYLTQSSTYDTEYLTTTSSEQTTSE